MSCHLATLFPTKLLRFRVDLDDSSPTIKIEITVNVNLKFIKKKPVIAGPLL